MTLYSTCLVLIASLVGLSASQGGYFSTALHKSKADITAALHAIGNQTIGSDVKNFDYAHVFGPDLTPDQQLAVVSAHENYNHFVEIINLHSNVRDDRSLITAENLEKMKKMASYASISYCSESVAGIAALRNWKCGPKCDDPRTAGTRVVSVFEHKSSFGYIAVNPSSKQIIVSFRGTSTIQNWIEDFDFILGDWPYPYNQAHENVKVHSGFIQAYEYIRTNLRPVILGLAETYSEYTVALTGDSLGAALSTITAIDLIGENELAANRIDLIVFASPRVGNAAFSELVKSAGLGFVHRYVYENDIVPHLPPMFLGYQHIDGELYNESGNVYVCNGPEDSACSNSRVPFLSSTAHAHFLSANNFFSADNCVVDETEE